MKQLNQASLAVVLASVFGGLGGWTLAAEMETTPQGVAKTLTELDTWILMQPKALAPLPGESFDLSVCKGFVITDIPRELAQSGRRPARHRVRCAAAAA